MVKTEKMRYADTYLIICLLTDQDMEDRAEMAVSCRTTSQSNNRNKTDNF